MKCHIVPIAFVTALQCPDVRAQQAVPIGPALSGNVSGVSDYRFRGISQTGQDPALQGGIEYGRADASYIGAWGSNVSWLSDLSTADAPISSSLEVDVYAGWRMQLDEAWKLDLGLYTYYYPGDYARGITRPHTAEVYVGISGSIFALKYSHALTNTFGFTDSKHSDYIDLSANWEFSPSWVLNGHVGHQRIKKTDRASYSDWKLGITRNLAGGFALALGYYDTNADASIYTNPRGEFLGRSTVVLSAAKTF